VAALTNPDSVRIYMEQAEGAQDLVVSRAVAQRTRLDHQIAEGEEVLSRCMTEVLSGANSPAMQALYRQKANEQEEKLRELRTERASLADAASHTERQKRELGRLAVLLAEAQHYFGEMPVDERRHWCKLFNVRVTVGKPAAPGEAATWTAESDLERWMALGLDAGGSASMVTNWVEYFYVTLES
jgi:hypothetical protein